MAYGTSFTITLSGETFSMKTGYSLSDVKDSELVAQSPKPNGDEPSPAMTKFQNPFPEFAFDKISRPDYGRGLSAITGLPANRPDYIADYHVIALMRCIDFMLSQGYNGKIDGNYDTPVT